MTAALALLAQQLIQANGRTVKIVAVADTPADNAKPWRGPAAVAPDDPDGWELELKAVYETYEESELKKALFGVAQATEEAIRRPRARFLIAALDVGAHDLRLADHIEDDGERWRILEVKTEKPGDVAIMYTVEVRQ